MTQEDRDNACELLRCAVDDVLAGIRSTSGHLLGAAEFLGSDGVAAFSLACDAWYRVLPRVRQVPDVDPWCLIALHAAQLLEEGKLP